MLAVTLSPAGVPVVSLDAPAPAQPAPAVTEPDEYEQMFRQFEREASDRGNLMEAERRIIEAEGAFHVRGRYYRDPAAADLARSRAAREDVRRWAYDLLRKREARLLKRRGFLLCPWCTQQVNIDKADGYRVVGGRALHVHCEDAFRRFTRGTR